MKRVPRFVDVAADGAAEDVLQRRVLVGHVDLEIAARAQLLVGETGNALALLLGLIRELADGIRHG